MSDKKDILIKKLDRLTDNGMAKTRKWVSMWQNSLQYFFGAQLEGRKERKNWDWVVLNYIWPSAMQEIAKLSKNEPQIVVQPWEATDGDVAEAWQGKLRYDWKKVLSKYGMHLEQIKAMLDTKLFGYRVSKVYWEPKCYWDGQQWIGDVKYRLWHPSHFWADDDEDAMEGNCGTQRWVDVNWAKSRWPKYASRIEDQGRTLKDVAGTTGEYIWGQYAGHRSTEDKGPTESRPYILDRIGDSDVMSAKASNQDVRIIDVQEYYIRDYEETTETRSTDIEPQELLDSGQLVLSDGIYYDTDGKAVSAENWPQNKVQIRKPKYPNGRYILRVGDNIIEDVPWRYSRWPFVIVPHYLLPHMWQGIDSVQLYKSTQDMINVTASHLYNNMKMFGDPKIAIEPDALVTPPGRQKKRITLAGGAGAVIQFARGMIKNKAFQVIPPMQLGQGELALYQLFTQEYKNMTGLQSIAKGEKVPGKMSATEANWLAVSSVDRIALQNIYEEWWVQEVCRLDAEISQDLYDEGRWIRIVGEDKILGVQQITQKLKDFKYDIEIRRGSMLPYDEEKDLQKYMTAYKMMAEPMPNPMLPEMLQKLTIPNWKNLLERHEMYQKFIQFVQLYEQVKAGNVEPEQAVRLLVQAAMEEYGKDQQQSPVAAKGPMSQTASR